MPNLKRQFLKEIADNPSSDEARLVYADWLDEQGDPQGEFIRTQISLQDGNLPHSRRNELESLERRLIKRHAKHWAGSLRPWVRRWFYDRGIITGILIDTQSLLQHADELFECHAINDLRIRQVHGFLAEVGDLPQLSQLQSLGLPHCYLGNAGSASRRFTYDVDGRPDLRQIDAARQEFRSASESIRAQNTLQLQKFLDQTSMPSLRRLILTDNLLGDDLAQALARSDVAYRLESLDLNANRLSHQAVAVLAQKECFKHLQHLRLGGCTNISHNYEEEDLTGPLFRELVPLLNRLTTLDSGRCGLTLQGAAFLAENYAGNLEALGLHGSFLYLHQQDNESLPFLETFMSSTLLRQPPRLDMGSSYVNDHSLAAMLVPKQTRHREVLLLNNSDFGRETGRLLGQALFPVLRVLHLDNQSGPSWSNSTAGMNNHEVSHFFRSTNYPVLANLSLRRHQLTAGCLESLLESPFLPQLYHVDLSRNLIADDGLQPLIDHGPWEQLAELNLRQNRISRAWKTKLINAFGDKILV